MVSLLITLPELPLSVLACNPELKIFALIASYNLPSPVRIGSHSLRCIMFWISMAEELAVVAAPHLQRLILYTTGTGCTMKVKIGYAPELTVLGYLETANHVLQIGNTIIKAGVTNVSPNAMVPSAKVLAMKVGFGVAKEVKSLLSFLRCFPHVETLHVVEISTASNLPQKEVGKYIKILGESLKLSQPLNNNSIAVHMPRFCSLLQLNKSAQVDEVQYECRGMVNQRKKEQKARSRGPMAVAKVTFFQQGTFPCVSVDGRFIMETPYKVAKAPDGNGGVYSVNPS